MTLDIKKMTRLRCHFSITMIMIFKVREECLKIDNDDEKTRKRQREKNACIAKPLCMNFNYSCEELYIEGER